MGIAAFTPKRDVRQRTAAAPCIVSRVVNVNIC